MPETRSWGWNPRDGAGGKGAFIGFVQRGLTMASGFKQFNFVGAGAGQNLFIGVPLAHDCPSDPGAHSTFTKWPSDIPCS
jgi:hypothetical protein